MPADTTAAESASQPPRHRPAQEFPGCRPIPLKREDLAAHDGRSGYWDGDTQTAWVVSEPTSATHEQPSQRLAGIGQVIAGVRGSPIECYGTMDLLLRNAQGAKWRIMQADQSVYLRPARARLPTDAMEIGTHDYPDVVLEVDHTTDVRRGKLGLYEAWGFPEVWVDVPESGYAVGRPSGLSPGLTIYLLEGGTYRTASQSRAFAPFPLRRPAYFGDLSAGWTTGPEDRRRARKNFSSRRADASARTPARTTGRWLSRVHPRMSNTLPAPPQRSSAAPYTTRSTRACTIAPAHITQGSIVA